MGFNNADLFQACHVEDCYGFLFGFLFGFNYGFHQRISGLICNVTRGVLQVFIGTKVRDAVIYTKHVGRRTVTVSHRVSRQVS